MQSEKVVTIRVVIFSPETYVEVKIKGRRTSRTGVSNSKLCTSPSEKENVFAGCRLK